MMAVLKDAIRAYIRDMDGRTAQARRNFQETYRWVHAVDQDGVFAYDNVCDTLGLEPGMLRRWLKSLHDVELAPTARHRTLNRCSLLSGSADAFGH